MRVPLYAAQVPGGCGLDRTLTPTPLSHTHSPARNHRRGTFASWLGLVFGVGVGSLRTELVQLSSVGKFDVRALS